MAQPDFLVIGAQKAGTTWLDKMFKSHPEIWTPPVKELQFFNELYMKDSFTWIKKHREEHSAKVVKYAANIRPIDWPKIELSKLICEENTNFDWYESIFDYAPFGSIKGEMTPEYSLLEQEHISDIASRYPFLKVIFVMRDPVERALSGIKMRLLQQGFGEESSQQEIDNFVIECARDWDVIERGNYEKIINLWQSYFPNGQCLWLLSDDLKNKPNATLYKLSDFLGLDEKLFRADSNEKVHVGKKYNISEFAIEEVENKQEANLIWFRENVEKYRI